jgi:hypothetical protein
MMRDIYANRQRMKGWNYQQPGWRNHENQDDNGQLEAA